MNALALRGAIAAMAAVSGRETMFAFSESTLSLEVRDTIVRNNIILYYFASCVRD